MENTTEQLKQLLNENTKLQQFMEQDTYLSQPEFHEVKESIDEIQRKLTNKKYSVAVIAAMKAGKSTLFNALLGRDLLPNETAACTAAITEIKYANIPSLTIEKHMKNGTKHVISSSANETVEQAFHRDVRESRANNTASDIEKYYVESPVCALENEQYKGLVENFVLIDTPGPNEADTGEFDASVLKEITYYQLRNADAIIFIFDYQVYKSDTNARLLNEIFAGREDIKKDNDKIFFVLNKIDVRNSKDGTKEEILNRVRELIRFQTEGIIENPQVLPVSALMALYGRQILNDSISPEGLEDCNNKYQSRYSEEVVINGKKYKSMMEGEDLANSLIQDSDIEALEKEVIIQTFHKASSKLVNGTKDQLKVKLDLMKDHVQSTIDVQSKGLEELQAGIQQSKFELLELEQFAQSISENTTNKVNIFMNGMQLKTTNIPSEISQAVNNVLNEYDNYYESQDQHYISQISSRIQRDVQHAVSNYALSKKDTLIREYNYFENDLSREIYQQFNALSQRADTIIRKNLKIDIETAGYLADFNDPEAPILNISPERSGDGPQVLDSDFKNQTMRGVSSAATGALLGARFGPVGAVVGGIAGFLLGIGTHQTQYEQPQQVTYRIDVSEIKTNIAEHYNKESKAILKNFESYFTSSTTVIAQSIEDSVKEFTAQINDYLDGLEKNFSASSAEREQRITQLNETLATLKRIEANIGVKVYN